MRLHNIEFLFNSKNNRYEIINWVECPYRYKAPFSQLIGFFEKNNEEWYMATVGKDFFANKDANIIAKHAHAFLNEAYGNDKDSKIIYTWSWNNKF